MRVNALTGTPFTLIGLLDDTGGRQLLVELANPPETGFEETPVQVDVLHQGGMYQFRTVAWSDPVHRHRLRLQLPEAIVAVQRRSSPRVSIIGDLAVWTAEGKHIVSRGEGHALNVSLGGLAFDAGFHLPVGSRIFVQFRAGDARLLGHLEGEVLRCSSRPDGSWTVAVAFRNLQPTVVGDLFELVQTRLRMETGYLESAVGALE